MLTDEVKFVLLDELFEPIGQSDPNYPENYTKSFEQIAIVDKYESMLWTLRARTAGEFELYTLVSPELIDMYKIGRYIMCESFYDKATDIGHLMMIEDVEISSDAENGDKLIVTGRSLKAILDRRIVWYQTTIEKGTAVSAVIKKLITDSIIDPVTPAPEADKVNAAKRAIPNFVFDDVEGDWGTIKKEIQFRGDSVYDAVTNLCEKYKISYEVVLNFTDKCFHMHLIKPVDHSYDQVEAPTVVFSYQFGNLKNSNYKKISSSYKNVALIHGEGDEYNALIIPLNEDVYNGINRREVYVDASSLSQEKEDGTIYSDKTYGGMLKTKGEKELYKDRLKETYEGESEDGLGYEFGVDYNIGDIVELLNEYDIETKATVSEMVLSISTSGISLVPTFESPEEIDDDEEEIQP